MGKDYLVEGFSDRMAGLGELRADIGAHADDRARRAARCADCRESWTGVASRADEDDTMLIHDLQLHQALKVLRARCSLPQCL